MEGRKKDKYLGTLRDIGVEDENLLIPFVAETTGRLGPAAEAFLKRLEVLPPLGNAAEDSAKKKVQWFRRRCLFAILSYSGKIAEQAMRHRLELA